MKMEVTYVKERDVLVFMRCQRPVMLLPRDHRAEFEERCHREFYEHIKALRAKPRKWWQRMSTRRGVFVCYDIKQGFYRAMPYMI